MAYSLTANTAAHWRDYLGVCKLKVVALIVFTALVGMFLAVPLTTALIIALDASPHTRPIAILLGPEIKESSDAADGDQQQEGAGERQDTLSRREPVDTERSS